MDASTHDAKHDKDEGRQAANSWQAATGPGASGRPAPERTVVLVLTPAEPLTKVVQVAARAAREQRVPLMMAMLPPHTHVGAPCMAALDAALEVARVTAPHLRVRAHTLSPQDVGARIGADELVVASPRTWAGLPEHVRVAHPPGPLLRLVEPD